jgi:type VII secretion protein EccE
MPELSAHGLTAGRFGRVQLVAVELAAIAGAAAAFATPPLAIGLSAAAVVVLCGALGRMGGRWVYEAVAARWRLRGRTRFRNSGLAALSPGLTIGTYLDRGTPIGIGHDSLGWFAVVSVVSANRVTLRVDWLARLLTGSSVPVTAVQLVTRRVPLVGPQDETAATAASYRELLGNSPAPALREMWLAVRLSPADAVEATSERGGEVVGVHRALSAAIARIGTALTAAGVGYLVPDAVGLRRIFTVACGLERPEPASEHWAGWHAAGMIHLCFAVRSLPAKPHPELLAELERVPAAVASHTAVILHPKASGGVPSLRVVLRFVTTPEHAAACARQAHQHAKRLGVSLVRLNGEHATGVYATSPSGAAQGLRPW